MRKSNSHVHDDTLQSAKNEAAIRREARMTAAAEKLAARALAATQARESAILLARGTAERSAKAALDLEQMQRKFQERLLKSERVAAKERSAREGELLKAKAEAARQRAIIEEHMRQQEKELRHEQSRRRVELETARAAAEERAAAEQRQAAMKRIYEERIEAEAQSQSQHKFYGRPAGTWKQRRPIGLMAAQRSSDSALLLDPQGEEIEGLPTSVLVLHVLRHQACPHRCLGLAPNARGAAVRKRYLALARRLHPDKTDHPSATVAFAAIESAFRGMQLACDV